MGVIIGVAVGDTVGVVVGIRVGAEVGAVPGFDAGAPTFETRGTAELPWPPHAGRSDVIRLKVKIRKNRRDTIISQGA
jgi:hypothetical protein